MYILSFSLTERYISALEKSEVVEWHSGALCLTLTTDHIDLTCPMGWSGWSRKGPITGALSSSKIKGGEFPVSVCSLYQLSCDDCVVDTREHYLCCIVYNGCAVISIKHIKIFKVSIHTASHVAV